MQAYPMLGAPVPKLRVVGRPVARLDVSSAGQIASVPLGTACAEPT